MGILTGSKIVQELEKGNLFIEDFKFENLNPNSYNLSWGNKIGIYRTDENQGFLDLKKNNPFSVEEIKNDFMLEPGTIYLMNTYEAAGSDHFVPCIEGRSSLARLGIQVHSTAGFGDLGFIGQWTLEVSVAQRIKIYPFVRSCQIYFYEPSGEIQKLYTGKYKEFNPDRPISSKMWLEML